MTYKLSKWPKVFIRGKLRCDFCQWNCVYSLPLWTWQMATEFRRVCFIELRNKVFRRRRALKDRSASHEETGRMRNKCKRVRTSDSQKYIHLRWHSSQLLSDLENGSMSKLIMEHTDLERQRWFIQLRKLYSFISESLIVPFKRVFSSSWAMLKPLDFWGSNLSRSLHYAVSSSKK